MKCHLVFVLYIIISFVIWKFYISYIRRSLLWARKGLQNVFKTLIYVQAEIKTNPVA